MGYNTNNFNLYEMASQAAQCAHQNCESSKQNATQALSSAQSAYESANNAAESAAEAAASAAIAGIYLGPFAVAPTTDNEGGPLQEGMLYFNTVSNVFFVWNGTTWASSDFNEFTNFTATGTTTPRNLVTRMADVVNVLDFGADPTGAVDSTAAIQAARIATNNEKRLFIPAGNYLFSGTTYNVGGDFFWSNDSFTGGVNILSSAQNSNILVTTQTEDSSPLDPSKTRVGIVVTNVAKGANHSDGIRANLINYSTDGNGNTAFYGSAVSDTQSQWSAAVHGETKHAGGTSIALSSESASFSSTGSMYGLVINQVTEGQGTNTHPTTGNPIAIIPNATATLIIGTGTELGSWQTGIDFHPNSLRSSANAIQIRSSCETGIRITSPTINYGINIQNCEDKGINIRGNAETLGDFRSRSGKGSIILGSENLNQIGDIVSGIAFVGKDDADISINYSDIITVITQNQTGNTGASLRFRTRSSGILGNTLWIENSYIRPGIDNVTSLGLGSARWSVVYAATGTINTSDEREKTFLSIESAEKLAAIEIKQNLRKFKFNSAIEEKGENARIHFGASAQQVGDIMKSHGLDPNKYGFYCYDEWDEIPEEKDNDGNVIKEYAPAGSRYGIRYEELLSFIISAI